MDSSDGLGRDYLNSALWSKKLTQLSDKIQ